MNIYPIKISDTDLASRQAAAELQGHEGQTTVS